MRTLIFATVFLFSCFGLASNQKHCGEFVYKSKPAVKPLDRIGYYLIEKLKGSPSTTFYFDKAATAHADSVLKDRVGTETCLYLETSPKDTDGISLVHAFEITQDK